MMQMIKKYLFYAILIGLVYMLLAYHYIYVGGRDIRLLKKETLNLKYTFFSLMSKTPEAAMKVDPLREAGIGDILVDAGLLTEEKKDDLVYRYDYE